VRELDGSDSIIVVRCSGRRRTDPLPPTRRRLEQSTGGRRYRGRVRSTDHLDELRRRLAARTGQGHPGDRVTANRLAQMRSRLNELERISENSTDEAVVMATEEEAQEIMSSLENVRELRSSESG
jgi:hypothetical protein